MEYLLSETPQVAGSIPARETLGLLAHLVEHAAVNRKVVGSKPTRADFLF